ncbi:hypothetical protein CTI12_AA559520 [Artemisia annua]|uniref:Uncharacterized protein n=1 Tax=Artemisia annua TaxID=35608 RepID=A0A2U1KVM5_ARTAN|nr:hypothetical protein CTI12_AA559520 [Artemisia annua]
MDTNEASSQSKDANQASESNGKQAITSNVGLNVQATNNISYKNPFNVLKDQDDDPRGDIGSLKVDIGSDSDEVENLIYGIRKKVGAPHRKTGIWSGKNADFDLLTKEDVKSILRDLQESDDDADLM